MLNPPLSTSPDYINNQIVDEKVVKIIDVVEIYHNDVPSTNSTNNLCPLQPSNIRCVTDPCCNTKSVTSSWEWFGLFVLWFIALTVLFWLIYYSLKPPFVLQSDGNQVDTAKVLLAAVISAFVLIVIIWLIKAAMGK
jgi:hypothetical protein